MERTLTSKLGIVAIAFCLLTVTAPGAVAPDAAGDCDEVAADEADLRSDIQASGVVCVDSVIDLDDGLTLTQPVTLTSPGDADGTLSFTGTDEGTATISVEADGATVSHLTIERNVDTESSRDNSSQFAQAVRVAASDVTVAHNTITGGEGLDDENNAGIMVLDGHGHAPSQVENLDILDNTVSGFAIGVGVGAVYHEGTSVRDVSIQDNEITESHHSGITLADGVAWAALGLTNGEVPQDTSPSIEDVEANENTITNNDVAIFNLAGTLLDARENFYGTAAGPVADEPVVGAVLFAPWCLQESCATTSESASQIEETVENASEEQLVDIQQPEFGAAFGPGADVNVEWTTPVSDFFLNQLFVVELRDADSHEVVQQTSDYRCAPTDVAQQTCDATLQGIPDGDWIVSVRPTLTQEDNLTTLSERVCMTTATEALPSTCDSVTISTGDITEVTDITPAGADDEWVNEDVQVSVACIDSLETCDIRYDTHETGNEPGTFSVSADQATVTLDQEGYRNLTWFGVDENGNEEAEESLDFQIDKTDPTTGISLDGTAGDNGWFRSDVTVTLNPTDELSGVALTEYRVDDGPWKEYQGPFPITQDGRHTVEYRSTDVAGNQETIQTETVKIDTVAPSTTADLNGEKNSDGIYETAVTVTLTANDATSVVAETEYNLDSTGWTSYDGSFDVAEDGEHTLEYRSVDAAGNLETGGQETFTIDKPAVINLTLQDEHDTYVPNGDSTELVYEATWKEGPDAGQPASGETVVLTDAQDSSFEREDTTNADGLVKFTIDETDTQRTFEATIESPTDGADVLDPDSTTVTWTDIELTRQTETGDVTDASPGWADVGDTYRIAYEVTQTIDGAPLEGAVVELDSGDFTQTGADGVAKVPVQEDTPSEVTFAPTASYDPDRGPTQTTSDAQNATVRWAKVIYENLAPDAWTDTLWYNASEEVDFSFETYLLFGNDTSTDVIPAEGATVTLNAVSETSDADQTQTLVVDGNGDAGTTLSFADNAKTTPTLSLASTDQGITVQEDADFGDQRWATLVVDDLTVTNTATDAYEDGWHAVGDQVDFGYQADLVFGADRASDSIPAEGTDLTFSLDEDVPVTVGADGEETVSRTLDTAFQGTPEISLVETPEGITATDIDAYDTQRWTEIDLTATPDDSFVNVGDEVTFDLTATWTHDGSQVSGVDVKIVDANGNTVQDCDSFTGSTTCSVTLDRVYNDDLTFEVTGTDVGITQQTDGTPTKVEMVWTEIEVLNRGVDDGFVGVGEAITMDATAIYAHTADDGSAIKVPSATLALGADAPSACTLDEGTVSDGSLTSTVTCTDVVDQKIPLVVASAHEDVTRLASPLNLSDTDRGENAVWTGLSVDYTTTDEDGKPIDSGTYLDHEQPVRFTGTVQFAHLADGEGTQPPTDWVEFQVLDNGNVDTNCIAQIDTEGKATCVTETRKDAGTYTFGAGAASFEEDADGYFVRDVTHVTNDPADVTFRWTSIAFQQFQCHGSASGSGDCDETTWSAGEKVEVTVTAVEADTGEVLSGATVTIDGNEKTTDPNGQATQGFISFSADCLDVTAAGDEADIDGTTVTWDTPRTETICWQ